MSEQRIDGEEGPARLWELEPERDTPEPMMPIVLEIKVIRPYVIEVAFEDGTRRRVDLESELWGEMFEPLRDPELFAQTRVDPELDTVVWPNGADLAPEFLYEARRKRLLIGASRSDE